MTLVDLPPTGCKFSVDTRADGEHLFCGEPRKDHAAYCCAHFRIAYRRATVPVAKIAAGALRRERRPDGYAAFKADLVAAMSDGVRYRA